MQWQFCNAPFYFAMCQEPRERHSCALRLFLYPAPRFAPCGSPAFAIKRIIGDLMFSPETSKEMTPDNTGEGDDKPVQGAEEKALYRMPVLVNTETMAVTRVLGAEKDKDTQRQASAVSGQIGHNAVTEFFMPEAFAAEKYKQADEVHRQSPGELKNIE